MSAGVAVLVIDASGENRRRFVGRYIGYYMDCTPDSYQDEDATAKGHAVTTGKGIREYRDPCFQFTRL